MLENYMNKDNTRLAVFTENKFNEDFYRTSSNSFHSDAIIKITKDVYHEDITGCVFDTCPEFVRRFGGVILQIAPNPLGNMYDVEVLIYMDKNIPVSDDLLEKVAAYLVELEKGYKNFHPLRVTDAMVFDTEIFYEFSSIEDIENCIKGLNSNLSR